MYTASATSIVASSSVTSFIASEIELFDELILIFLVVGICFIGDQPLWMGAVGWEQSAGVVTF